MTIHENLTSFGGKPVVDFRKPGDIANPSAVAPRVRCEYDDKETLVDFLKDLFGELEVEFGVDGELEDFR